MAALCNTTFRLRELMPILKSTKLNEKAETLDQDHQYYYPLLVNATTSAAHNNIKSEPNWDILLSHLLDIIALPVRNAILNSKKPDNDLKSLSTNCSHLVARVVAELSSQATLSEVIIMMILLLITKYILSNIFVIFIGWSRNG